MKQEITTEDARLMNDRYQNFIRNSTEGIWRFELDELIPVTLPVKEQVAHFYRHAYLAECNDATARMYGYEFSEQLIGKKLDEFLPVNEESDAYLAYFVESGYKAEAVESKEMDKHGNLKYFSNNLIGVVENGLLVRAWGMQRDITAQKEAEQTIRNSENELRQLSNALELKVQLRTAELAELNNTLRVQNETFRQAEESSKQGSYSFNLTTGRLDYSDNLYRLLGYEPKEFAPGLEEFNKHVHPDDRQYVTDSAHAVLTTNQPAEWKYRMIKKSGEMIYIRGTGRVIPSDHGTLLVGTLQDITPDVLLREALQQKNLELERSNTELQQFAHVASHDLKEPLRKILTYSNLLRSELTDISPAVSANLEKITKAAERMKNMVDGILEYSFVDATDLPQEEVSLSSLVEDITHDLELMINQKNARISYKELPVLKGSRVLLYQLFYNLLNNSLKFTGPGVNPVITIQAQKQIPDPNRTPSANGNFYEIILSDNGIGFEKDQADNIFKTFTRLHSKDKYEGTGIGLALCKKIVERHNGMIHADSNPGKGAKFSIRLPG